jgi:hypothetical protein
MYFNNLVIYIREVTHVRDIKAPRAKISHEEIEDDCRPGVSDMAAVIDSDAAHIDAHFPCLQRLKYIFLSGGRVVKSERQLFTPYGFF